MKKILIFTFLVAASISYSKSLNGIINSNKHLIKDVHKNLTAEQKEELKEFAHSLSSKEKEELRDFHKKMIKYKTELLKHPEYRKYKDPTNAFLKDYFKNPDKFKNSPDYSESLKEFLQKEHSDLEDLRNIFK